MSRRMGHTSAFHPKAAFVQRHAMLAVLPLHIAVAGLFEAKRLEPGSDRQLAKPALYWDVHAIRSGIADDEARAAAIGRNSPQRQPNLGQVAEVRRHHRVIRLLPTARLAHTAELLADGAKLR